MLHSVIIMSTSGIVLFVKEFINTPGRQKASQLGGIITAMLKFSIQRTGLPVSYIELQNVGVSIQSASDAKVTCAVFHDQTDGCEFGTLIAKELLDAFTQTYSSELQEKFNSPDVFNEFNTKIAAVIRNAVKPVLDMLQDQRGIVLVLLSGGDQIQHSTQDVDKLAVLANHQALMGVATDILAAENDVPLSMTLRSRRTTLVLQRIERSSLVVVYKNSVDSSVCMKEIDHTAQLLRKVLVMASNLNT